MWDPKEYKILSIHDPYWLNTTFESRQLLAGPD
jgi:hypothetical protein